jgi:hypothetical protein
MPDDHDPFRHWATNADGKRVLRGLSVDETQEYEAYLAKIGQWRTSHFEWPERAAARHRFLDLHNKHEPERLQAIMTETRLCRDCRYADFGPPEPVCLHGSSIIERRVDLATDRMMTPYLMTCHGARQPVRGHCGPDGRFWEARER